MPVRHQLESLLSLTKVARQESRKPENLEAGDESFASDAANEFSRFIAILSAKNDDEVTNDDVQELRNKFFLLKTALTGPQTFFDELLDKITTLEDAINNKVVVTEVETPEVLGYPKAQNDFEQFLIDQSIPLETFFPTDEEKAKGDNLESFYRRKYDAFQKYFVSILINRALAVADVEQASLFLPNVLSMALPIRGIEQGKTAQDVIKTMSTVDNPQSKERDIAAAASLPLRNRLLVLSSWTTAFDNMKASGHTAVRSSEGLSKFYAESFTQPAYMQPGALLGLLDFPLLAKSESDPNKWEPVDGDSEPLKEKIFQSMKKIIERRLRREHRSEPDSMYSNLYVVKKVYLKGQEPPTEEEPDPVVFRESLLPAFHYDEFGRRRSGRLLKLKSIPHGPDGALYPRLTSTKDPSGQQEAVRRNILRELAPDTIISNEESGWSEGESINEFIRRSNDSGEGKKYKYITHKPSVFALLWAEMMGEVTMESFFQDARTSKGKEFGNAQREVALLTDMFNPSVVAARYESGGEKGAKFNSFVVGWQSFLLNYFDFILLPGKDGRLRTLAQHILVADNFDEVPWSAMDDSIVKGWLDQIRHMSNIASISMDGFKNGNLRNLSEIDLKTNEVSKINEKMVDEMIALYRDISTYMLQGYCSPEGFTQHVNLGSDKANAKEKERLALQSGQFIKIRIECQNPNNPSEVWERSIVTRAHQYLMFDNHDILNWIPRDQRSRLGKDHFAGFVNEKTDGVEHRTLLVRIDAAKGAKSVKEALPNPNTILTREILTRVISASASSGDTLANFKNEDALIIGLIFSEEIRDKYQNRYFASVGWHEFTKFKITMVKRLEGLLRGRIDHTDIQLELPQSIGPSIFTQEQFMVMLEKIGHKITFEELLKSGENLVAVLAGQNISDKK